MKPTQPAETSKVTPPASWSVVSAYGSLRTFSGVDLVRLEDIHAEMCAKGVPPKEATYVIFGSFFTDWLNREDKDDVGIISQLYAACAMDRPLVLFRDGRLTRQEHAQPFGMLPQLGHVTLEDDTPAGVVYSLAEAALRVWQGEVDPSTDHVEMRKAKKAEAEDRKYGIEWPSDDSLRKVVGRLAVSHELAHQLWGWGTVGAIAGAYEPSKQEQSKSAKAVTSSAAEPVGQSRFDWGAAATQAALVAAFRDAPGKSVRAKAEHLANTEKWGAYSGETLRKKHDAFLKKGAGARASQGVSLSNAWVNTQSKGRKAG